MDALTKFERDMVRLLTCPATGEILAEPVSVPISEGKHHAGDGIFDPPVDGGGASFQHRDDDDDIEVEAESPMPMPSSRGATGDSKRRMQYGDVKPKLVEMDRVVGKAHLDMTSDQQQRGVSTDIVASAVLRSLLVNHAFLRPKVHFPVSLGTTLRTHLRRRGHHGQREDVGCDAQAVEFVLGVLLPVYETHLLQSDTVPALLDSETVTQPSASSAPPGQHQIPIQIQIQPYSWLVDVVRCSEMFGVFRRHYKKAGKEEAFLGLLLRNPNTSFSEFILRNSYATVVSVIGKLGGHAAVLSRWRSVDDDIAEAEADEELIIYENLLLPAIDRKECEFVSFLLSSPLGTTKLLGRIDEDRVIETAVERGHWRFAAWLLGVLGEKHFVPKLDSGQLWPLILDGMKKDKKSDVEIHGDGDVEEEGESHIQSQSQPSQSQEEVSRDSGLALLESLLQAGMSCSVEDGSTSPSPFLLAIQESNLPLFSLLSPRIPLDVLDARINGKRPLIWAIENACTEIVKLLLDRGVTVNFYDQDELDDVPFIRAASLRRCDVIRELWRVDADAKVVDRRYRNALHLASMNGHNDVVAEILSNTRRRDLMLNRRDEFGNTPLHYAFQNQHGDIGRQLVKAGARTDVLNKYGRTPENETLLGGSIVAEVLPDGQPAPAASQSQDAAPSASAASSSSAFESLLGRVAAIEAKHSERVESLQYEVYSLMKTVQDLRGKNQELLGRIQDSEKKFEDEVQKFAGEDPIIASERRFEWHIPRDFVERSRFLHHVQSPVVHAFYHEWCLRFYPTGAENQHHAALYVMHLSGGQYAKYNYNTTFKITLKNNDPAKDVVFTASNIYKKGEYSWGFANFVALREISSKASGFWSGDPDRLELTLVIDMEYFQVVEVARANPFRSDGGTHLEKRSTKVNIIKRRRKKRARKSSLSRKAALSRKGHQ